MSLKDSGRSHESICCSWASRSLRQPMPTSKKLNKCCANTRNTLAPCAWLLASTEKNGLIPTCTHLDLSPQGWLVTSTSYRFFWVEPEGPFLQPTCIDLRCQLIHAASIIFPGRPFSPTKMEGEDKSTKTCSILPFCRFRLNTSTMWCSFLWTDTPWARKHGEDDRETTPFALWFGLRGEQCSNLG